jgi:hypothetical protein
MIEAIEDSELLLFSFRKGGIMNALPVLNATKIAV